MNSSDWREITAMLWRVNHSSLNGVNSLESVEDMLSIVEAQICRETGYQFTAIRTRRIKYRNTRRIQRIERALFDLAGRRHDHAQKFCDALKTVIFLSMDRPF